MRFFTVLSEEMDGNRSRAKRDGRYALYEKTLPLSCGRVSLTVECPFDPGGVVYTRYC